MTPINDRNARSAEAAARRVQHDVDVTMPATARLSVGPVPESVRAKAAALPGWDDLHPADPQLTITYQDGTASYLSFSDDSENVLTARLAEAVRVGLTEAQGQGWPPCPWHPRHPLVVAPFNGNPTAPPRWVCPLNDALRCEIGRLTAPTTKPDPVPNGTVRWWLPLQGYGVIADAEGDVWVNWSVIEGQPGFRDLAEGDRVTYTVETIRGAGRFRVALSVRRM